MKRYGNLYNKICDIENIKLAHINARRGKSHYREVKKVDSNLDFYIEQLKDILQNKKFVNGKYTTFTKNDKGKERTIFKLPYYPDRIIHHAILQVLEPIWVKSFIKNTYQSIKGRGVHKAKKDLQESIKSLPNDSYYLQMDIHKFYPSVNNEILKQTIRKKIKCKDTLWLLDTIIDSTDGLPIGNYLSQYLGNLYITEFDHYIKETLKVKHYYRYCDDLVFIGDKSTLQQIEIKVIEFIGGLKLKVKDTYSIKQISEGIDFLGFVFYKGRILLRNSIKSNMYRTIKNNKSNVHNSLASYYGWVMSCNAKGLWKNINRIRYNIQGNFKPNFNP